MMQSIGGRDSKHAGAQLEAAVALAFECFFFAEAPAYSCLMPVEAHEVAQGELTRVTRN
jgi:hypothetical protein